MFVRLLIKEISLFEKGMFVLLVYLVKGIEFDVVIIYNVLSECY